MKLTRNEIDVIRDLTKPSGFERLYKNLADLESTNSQLNTFLEKSNYSKVTDIYTRKSMIKQGIIKNQLGLLLIYQLARTSKIKEDNLYDLNLKTSLVSILLETLIIKSLKLEKISHNRDLLVSEKNEIKIINDIIDKISDCYEIDEIYMIAKKMHNDLDIIAFKNLVGGNK